MRKLDSILSAIETTFIVGLTLLGLAMAFLQVVLRYVFNTGLHWLEAGLVTALVWAMLLGASRAVRDGLHPRVDLIPTLVSPKIRALLNVLALGTTMALVCFFLWDSVFYAKFINMINALHPEFEVKMIYPFLIIPITTGLMLIRYSMLAWALWYEPDAFSVEEEFCHRMRAIPVNAQVKK